MEKQQNVFVVEHNKENMHKQRRSSKPEFLDARSKLITNKRFSMIFIQILNYILHQL